MQLNRHLAVESVGVLEGVDVDLINQLSDANPRIPNWDGFDLDKTLAFFDEWNGPLHIGEPISAMIEQIKQTIAEGRIAKIFTARVSYTDERVNAAIRKAIQAWCLQHIGQVLEITNIKDMGMVNLYDDRAYHVVPNQGTIVRPNKHTPEEIKEFSDGLKADLQQ